MTWTLLGTMALTIIPLLKPKVDPDKARIAELEKDIAQLTAKDVAWAKESEAAKAYIAELERDRARLLEAYLSRAAPNQWSQNQQQAQAQTLAQYQQYRAMAGLTQQAAQQLLYPAVQQGRYFDCTCVPERSAALRGD